MQSDNLWVSIYWHEHFQSLKKFICNKVFFRFRNKTLASRLPIQVDNLNFHNIFGFIQRLPTKEKENKNCNTWWCRHVSETMSSGTDNILFLPQIVSRVKISKVWIYSPIWWKSNLFRVSQAREDGNGRYNSSPVWSVDFRWVERCSRSEIQEKLMTSGRERVNRRFFTSSSRRFPDWQWSRATCGRKKSWWEYWESDERCLSSMATLGIAKSEASKCY